MECQNIKNKLERFIDNELSGNEKKEVEIHISNCPQCARELEILRSVHRAGQMNFIQEPPSGYWNELTQNIRNRISDLQVKPSKLNAVFENIKKILWPGRIRYRLVSITATAVVLFFVIRISFFTNGKFEIPIESLKQDRISTTESEMKTKESTDALQRQEDIEMKEVSIDPPPVAQSPIRASEDEEATISTNRLTTREEPSEDHPLTVAGVATKTDKMDESIEIDKTVFQEHVRLQPAEASRRVTAVKTLDETRILKTESAVKPSLKRPIEQADAVFAEMDKQEEIEPFEVVSLRIKNTKEIPDKIAVWEKYLLTNPEPQHRRQAIYEMSQLYYQWAKTGMAESQIKQSILFFEHNIEILITDDKKSQIETQLEELKNLLKK